MGFQVFVYANQSNAYRIKTHIWMHTYTSFVLTNKFLKLFAGLKLVDLFQNLLI